MTAEIAILNRTAVALAADSAVTLNVRGRNKIYNSVDKLFQLSLTDPVGIMVFGGAEFMGIPIETVIKNFRSHHSNKSYDRLSDYSQAFFAFLENEVSVPRDLVELNIQALVMAEANSIYQKAQNKLLEQLQEGHLTRRSKGDTFSKILQTFIEEMLEVRIAQLSKFDSCQIYADLVPAEVILDYEAVIRAAIDGSFGDGAYDGRKERWARLAELILLSDEFSASRMGLVFAGFGRSELFPTMEAFYADGVISGRVKRKRSIHVDIDRRGIGAHIEAFAQKEMVDRFLDGIDPSFERYLLSSFRESLVQFGQTIVETYVKGSSTSKNSIKKAINDAANKQVEVFLSKSNDRKATNFRQKILDMVHFMPKSDLAAMAESLVNITSIKRRVSAEEETVGGPIDCAIISRGDGFIWIKRKHYFDAQLNPRYFVTKQMK